MKINYSRCSLEQLSQLFDKVERELQTAVLGSADWKEVQDKRALITELGTHIFKKRQQPAAEGPDSPFQK